MNKQIVIIKRGELTSKDKERLSKAGIVYIEAEYPRDVILWNYDDNPDATNDVAMSALYAIENHDNGRSVLFIKELNRRLSLRESKS